MILLTSVFKKLQQEIETPALLVDTPAMKRNIGRMQQLADQAGVALRPHCKTHKSVRIATMQINAGAKGITVAKLGEAEIMAEGGIEDIFIANQVAHPLKLDRLADLHRKYQISLGVDHPDQVAMLRKIFTDPEHPLKVMIEIDCGLHRCGVTIGPGLTGLCREIMDTPGLHLRGLFTHAGHAYGAADRQAVSRIGRAEGTYMQRAAAAVSRAATDPEVISVGSTPTVPYSAKNPAVTEIRPGNYVFYDRIQVALDVCREEDCALAVLATIIARPAPDRLVIDAGSKALNLDLGAHAVAKLSGFGKPVNLDGEIERLSEEHGIIKLRNGYAAGIGDPVLIIPNHACTVSNLYDYFYFVVESGAWEKVPIDARGRSD